MSSHVCFSGKKLFNDADLMGIIFVAIVLFGEPTRWESNLQVLLDVLLTNGQPYRMLKNFNKSQNESGSTSHIPYPHIPLLACNMDMQWMAEAPLPRLGHGCFLLALESLYEKLSSRKLLYTALIGKPSELTYHYAEYRLNKVAQDFLDIHNPIKHIYCIGDNPQTDVYGANLYNKYLEAQQGSRISEEVLKTRQSVGGSSTNGNNYIPYAPNDFVVNSSNSVGNILETMPNHVESQYAKIIGNETVIKAGFAAKCESVLVLTGVTRKDSTMDMNSLVEMMSQSNVNHNHRDFPDYPEMKIPQHVVHSVDEAVLYAYDKEKFRF